MGNQWDREFDPRTGEFLPPRAEDPRLETLKNQILEMQKRQDREQIINRIGEDVIKNIEPLPVGQLAFKQLQLLEGIAMARRILTEHNKNRVLRLYDGGQDVPALKKAVEADIAFFKDQLTIAENNLTKLKEYLDDRGRSPTMGGSEQPEAVSDLD